MKYEATNEGYKRYLGLWKRETAKAIDKGAVLEGLAAIPKTFSEYEFELLIQADKALAGGEKLSNYKFENKVAHDLVYVATHERTAAQSRKLEEAQHIINRELGTDFAFTAKDFGQSGFEKGRGAEFYAALDKLYHDKKASGLTAAESKAWIAKFIFGSD